MSKITYGNFIMYHHSAINRKIGELYEQRLDATNEEKQQLTAHINALNAYKKGLRDGKRVGGEKLLIDKPDKKYL